MIQKSLDVVGELAYAIEAEHGARPLDGVEGAKESPDNLG